ncbi:acyltransferase [Nibrella viscosa]|uniref:Acyltransferase n=1 Tax=Nibrella viscosa TaxID=1084524 RepID=A0ABP8K6I4_9BACT
MNSSPYLSTLTPLRGIAALLVVVFHSTRYVAPLVDPNVTSLIESGWLWVDFFFILSGFILSHVYGTQFETRLEWRSYRTYVLARFARVYPLHFFTLWVCVGLVLGIKALADGIMPNFQPAFNLSGIPASLLLIQSMYVFPEPPLNGPAWSLSTEWWVYLLFPLLVRPLLNLRIVGKLILLLAIAAMYLALVYYIAPHWANRFWIKLGLMTATPTLNMTGDFGFLRCVAGFTLGMLLYRLYQERVFCKILKSDWSFIAFLGGVLTLMHFGAGDLLIVALFPPVILAAAHNASSAKRILETRPLQYLGNLSFSIYMVHIPIVYAGYCLILLNNPKKLASIDGFGYYKMSYADGWLQCATLVVATLLVSALTYRFVEVPARRYLNARNQARRTAQAMSDAVLS